MRRFFASLFALTLFFATPAFALMEDYPSVKLQGLDKSVGRTVTFEAKVGSTIQYGPLFIKIHACRKAPPIEKPESAAFLQIWEVPPGGDKSEWVFSGWMFASSPALSAMDHPVYDVWVLECTGREPAIETPVRADEVPGKTDTAQPTEKTADPAQEEPIPTDSEAQEPDDRSEPVQQEQADPNATPETFDPANQTLVAPETAGPTDVPAETPPQDPTGDPRTAYDFMREQQGTGATSPSQETADPAVFLPPSGY